MRVIECQQYSEAWWNARRGIPTASEFHRIITNVRGEPSKGQKAYIAQLLADRVSLNPPFHTERQGHTQAMRNGIDLEPEARRWYEIDHGQVSQVGFCLTDDGRFGCSPDGVIYERKRCLELKCPEPHTHMEYLMDGSLPTEYRAQVHGQIIVTGFDGADFLSYCQGANPFLVEVCPDSFTEKLRAALEEFWDAYNEASMKHLGEPAPGCRIDPAAYKATLEAFTATMSRIQTVEEVNNLLPEIAELRLQEPVKRGVWDLVRTSASERGWMYNAAEKRFEPSPEF